MLVCNKHNTVSRWAPNKGAKSFLEKLLSYCASQKTKPTSVFWLRYVLVTFKLVNSLTEWFGTRIYFTISSYGEDQLKFRYFEKAKKNWTIFHTFFFWIIKGQIKAKADWRTVDSPQKQTNKFVSFFCHEKQKSKKKNKFVRLFFEENLQRDNLLMVLTDL